ncbi:Metallo-dependent phosphatase-like protein [Mycena pura]|uniref:Metallo-dependent phosphatase-like protein n=1 Tax=Mycena pura TaxID=153505 RepID=A0AAD6V2U6_9AGAR|nr:Metallo-dependent phosphatase-like protein [Mycena pura]
MTSIILERGRCIISPTSIVQLAYSPTSGTEPKPAPEGWTRFVLLSDTHAQTFPVPAGDVLLHAGDLTRRGTFRDLRHTMHWLYALPHPIKIVITGNRDFALHREWYDVHWTHTGRPGKPAVWEPPDPIFELLAGARAHAANIVYLRDERYAFRVRPDGREWSVYGSPQSPNFGARVRAFGYDAADAPAVVSGFPAVDILLTHGPPYGVLDCTTRGACAGCPALTARLSTLRPRLHVFGHIHEARGAYIHRWAGGAGAVPGTQMDGGVHEDELVVGDGEQTVFVNAANFPAGPNAVSGGEPVHSVGGPGVQPVVVDLLD